MPVTLRNIARRALTASLSVLLFVACAGDGPTASPSPAPRPEAPAPPSTADPEDLLEELRLAVRDEPGNTKAHRHLAIKLHSMGQKEDALVHFEKAAELEPENVRGLLDLALAYTGISRLRDAETVYGRLLALEPKHAIALHNLGNLAFKRGEFETAITYYNRSIAAEPSYILARIHLGDAFDRLELPKEAYRAYETTLQIKPRTPEQVTQIDSALYAMARLDLRMGATERALLILRGLVDANPENAQAHYALGDALMRIGREDEARVAFDRHQELLTQTSEVEDE